MPKIPTVRGLVDTSTLGVTLMHEHLCFRAPEAYQAANMAYQVELLQKALDVGVNTVVDCSPDPNLAKIVKANEQVPGMNLILSVGAYIEPKVKPAGSVAALSEQGFEEYLLKTFKEGYAGFESTGIRPGLIKIASHRPTQTEWEKKNFRAAARVQKALSIPICVHSVHGARTQMQILREHGADISATYYCHVEAEFGWEGRKFADEVKYLEEVLAAGGSFQFNNFDFDCDTPFEDLVALINTFEKDGFGDQLFYAIDANWSYDAQGKRLHQYEDRFPKCGKRTYAYAVTHASTMLMSAGVSLQRIWKYLVENPRRYFERVYARKEAREKRG